MLLRLVYSTLLGALGVGGLGGCGPLPGPSQAPEAPPVPVLHAPPHIELAAGDEHTCAVLPTGSVLCWGANGHGQLGDGTEDDRDRPVPMHGIHDAVDVSAGRSHTCVLRKTGDVWCTGVLDERAAATEHETHVARAIGLTGEQIASAGDHVCVRSKRGPVRCLGGVYLDRKQRFIDGDPGELQRYSAIVPVEVLGTDGGHQLIVGHTHGCVIGHPGPMVSCWAHPRFREALGPAPVPTAEPLPEGEGWAAPGNLTGCTIHDGLVRCGRMQDTLEPHIILPDTVELPQGRVYGVSAGGPACASIQQEDEPDPQVYCWGERNPPGVPNRAPKVRIVPGSTNIWALAAGLRHVCGLDHEHDDWGRIRCWGANDRGQLGVPIHKERSEPVLVEGLVDAQAISATEGYACALRPSGTVACWGNDGLRGPMPVSTRVREVPGLSSVTAISAGREQLCVLDIHGAVRCIGDWPRDQVPTVREVTLPGPAAAVVVGSNKACAVHSEGRVSCWGYVGGERVTEPEPVVFPGPVGALAVDASICGVIGVDGRVFCSGGPRSDQRALDMNIAGAVDVAAHGSRVCARIRGEGVRCASVMARRPAADEHRSRPDKRAISLSMWNHVCIIDDQQRPDCWNDTEAMSDTQIYPLDAQQIASGRDFACALEVGGTVRCWGHNASGELGAGEGLFRVDATGVGSTF